MKMRLLMVSAAAVCGVPSAHAIDFLDTEFLDTDWTASELVDTTPGGLATFTAIQQTSGGNPDAYRQTEHFYHEGSILVNHVRGGFTHNITPGSFLTHVSYSFDVNIFPVGGMGAVAYGLSIRQGTNVYIDYHLAFPTGWHSLSFSNLIAGQFDRIGGPGHPDFINGGLTEFGYFTSNGTDGGPTFTRSGIDNFSVTLRAVPEPTSLLTLSGLGLGLLIRCRRSRLLES